MYKNFSKPRKTGQRTREVRTTRATNDNGLTQRAEENANLKSQPDLTKTSDTGMVHTHLIVSIGLTYDEASSTLSLDGSVKSASKRAAQTHGTCMLFYGE